MSICKTIETISTTSTKFSYGYYKQTINCVIKTLIVNEWIQTRRTKDMSMNVNTTATTYGNYQNNYQTSGTDKKNETTKSTKTTETKKSSVESLGEKNLSRAAQKVLKDLRGSRNDMDFYVADFENGVLSPFHRQSGDIDLLILDDQQFLKGCRLMEIISNSCTWDKKSPHAEFQAMGFVVELHGKYSFIINRKVTDRLIEWNAKRNQEVRVEQGLILPSLQFDAVFIFTHMLNHFMTGGVGLRQISDWMMFVNAYFDKLDMKVLEDDLNFLGIMKFWQAFASLAVMQLGFPEKKMPFYDARWNRKADTLMDAIFKTGNFGALQKAKQLSKDTNKWVKKLHTAFGQFPVYWRVGKIFPAEAVYCFLKYSKWQIFGR